MAVLVYINGHSFVAADADTGDLESRILEAVRAGGAFIDIIGARSRTTRAFVGPASGARIEQLPAPDDRSDFDDDLPDLAFLDLGV